MLLKNILFLKINTIKICAFRQILYALIYKGKHCPYSTFIRNRAILSLDF